MVALLPEYIENSVREKSLYEIASENVQMFFIY